MTMLRNKPATCSFEFKTLRLIRVLSAQIAGAVTTTYTDTHAIFALAMLPLRQLQNALCFFGKRKFYFQRKLFSSFRCNDNAVETFPNENKADDATSTCKKSKPRKKHRKT